MKLLLPFLLLSLLPLFFCTHHMAKSHISYKKTRLSILSHGVPQEFNLLLGYHEAGLIFQITGNILSQDSSKFFSEACYLKEKEIFSIPPRFQALSSELHTRESPQKKGKGLKKGPKKHKFDDSSLPNKPKSHDKLIVGTHQSFFDPEEKEFYAFLDYRLVDCAFHFDEFGIFPEKFTSTNVQNHEGNTENTWTIGLAPAEISKDKDFERLANKLKTQCEIRKKDLRSLLEKYAKDGDIFHRALKEVQDANRKLKELKRTFANIEGQIKRLEGEKSKSAVDFEVLKHDTAKKARKLLDVSHKTKYLLTNKYNKHALDAQIHGQIKSARERIEVEAKNVNEAKKKIEELIPDAKDITERAYAAAFNGKYQEELAKIKIVA